MDRVRVNIRSVANVKAVRTETRANGREVIVVPSATLPDDVVMNSIKYPADEIANSFHSLEKSPAPLGHPVINGEFVSAYDQEAQNMNSIGAWNENVRRENGRVFLDKVIDVEVANRTEEGREVLAAINKGDAIHTSTGLFCNLDDPDDDGHKHVARNIYFDHDAILLNEEGAATPDQGVGMMVNKAKDRDTGKQIQVINSAVEWADRDLDWAVSSVVDALERREKAGVVERIKSALIEAFGSGRETPQNNESEDIMTVTDEQFNELSETVNALSETMKGLPDLVANAVKPLVDAQAELQANAQAAEEAQREELVNKLVKANVFANAEEAEGMKMSTLRNWAEKAKPGKAAALNAAPGTNYDEFVDVDFDLNALMEEK